MIEIPKWLFYSILTFLILLQFPLSYILGRLLGEITLRRRRMGHPIPTQYNHDSPNQHEHRYNRTHPTTITQLVEQHPNKKERQKTKQRKPKQPRRFCFHYSFRCLLSQVLYKSISLAKKGINRNRGEPSYFLA
jgi:hypothetical protein